MAFFVDDEPRRGMGGGHGKGRKYQSKKVHSGCAKRGYSSRAAAAHAAARAQETSGHSHPITAYHCDRCHIGHRPFWHSIGQCPSTGRHALCDLPAGHTGRHGGLGPDANYYVWD
jgi:hypothetical protein